MALISDGSTFLSGPSPYIAGWWIDPRPVHEGRYQYLAALFDIPVEILLNGPSDKRQEPTDEWLVSLLNEDFPDVIKVSPDGRATHFRYVEGANQEDNMIAETIKRTQAANMKAETIATEPTIDEMPAPITIGSFGFGNAEDAFKDEDVIVYFEYV